MYRTPEESQGGLLGWNENSSPIGLGHLPQQPSEAAEPPNRHVQESPKAGSNRLKMTTKTFTDIALPIIWHNCRSDTPAVYAILMRHSGKPCSRSISRVVSKPLTPVIQ